MRNNYFPIFQSQRARPCLTGPLAALGLLLAAATAAQAQTPASFAAASTYSAGTSSSPVGVALADVNGDGRRDIVTANYDGGAAGVLLGQASGGFATVITYPAGGGPYAIAVADMNGDGRPDIVTANDGGGAGVLLGQAGGGFAAVATYPTGGSPRGVALTDVNGDGRRDIVTANVNNATVGVLLGQASGGFAAVVTYATGAGSGSGSRGVAVADLNGDGRPDIVTANNNATAGVLLGQASGGFAAVTTYSTGAGSFPVGVAVADLNGDGRPDIVTADYSNSTAGVLLGQASGGFAAVSTFSVGPSSSPNGVAVADVNGDGRPDIVTGNEDGTAKVLLGQAGGGFAAFSTFSAGANSLTSGVAVADMSGDGRPDIVTVSRRSSNSSAGVLLNTGTFTPLATAASLAAAEVALFPNPAQGGFTVRLPAAFGAAPVRLELLSALGQVVATHAEALPAGGATVRFATNGLAAGVYVLRVRASGQTLAKRVVLD